MNPTVSFIVACYNYGHFVAQAIDSLLGQTLEDLEIIVIDDASTDDTMEVLGHYRNEPRVRIVHHRQNQGHIRTYNEGLALARGRYVGLMSADDYFQSREAVARQVAIFEAHPTVGMVYMAQAMIGDDGVTAPVIPWPDDFVRSGFDELRTLIWANSVPHSGTLLRADVQAELGPYEISLPHSADWDLWMRAAMRHDVGYIAEPLLAYRVHAANMHHKAIPPWRVTENHVLSLERAFAALPSNTPADIWEAREGVLRHALLKGALVDLYFGRRLRTWQGVGYAVKRRPSLLLHQNFWDLTLRAAVMTVVGRERMRLVKGWFGQLRRRHALAAT